MKYLKKYNEGLFSRKKEDEGSDWRSRLEWILNNYKSKSVKRLSAEVGEDTVGATLLKIYWDTKQNKYNHYMIFSGEEVESDLPLKKDRANRVACDVTDNDEWPEISDEDFNRYRVKIQEISDYLDENEKFTKSTVGSDGINLDIDENEIKVMAAQEELKKLFKDYFNKEYKFEAEFHEWITRNKNEKRKEDITISIYDISGDARGEKDFYLMIKCKLGDRKMKFMVDNLSTDENIDIESIPYEDRYRKVLKLYDDEDGLSRVQKRELKNRPYPHINDYDMVPSDWPAIEFMKDCKNLINTINDQMGDK